MKGQWIFVLLCLSLVGELVLGSLFPQTPDSPPSAPPESSLQQEVSWPLKNLDTKSEVKEGNAGEVKIIARDFYEEQTHERNSETRQKAVEVPQKIIIVNTTEQKSGGEIATINNSETETKNKLPKDVHQ